MDTIITFKFRSTMPDEELIERMQGRVDKFRAVDGLLQKYYGREAATGAFCGVYLFASAAQATAFREGLLNAGIADALAVDGEIRIEQLDVYMATHVDQYVNEGLVPRSRELEADDTEDDERDAGQAHG